MGPGFFVLGLSGQPICFAFFRIDFFQFDFSPHKMYNLLTKMYNFPLKLMLFFNKKYGCLRHYFLPQICLFVCLFVQSVWSWICCQLSQLLPFVQVCPDFTQLPDFRFHPIAQIWISPNCTKPCPESTKSTFQKQDSSQLNARSSNTRIGFWKWQVF